MTLRTSTRKGSVSTLYMFNYLLYVHNNIPLDISIIGKLLTGDDCELEGDGGRLPIYINKAHKQAFYKPFTFTLQ